MSNRDWKKWFRAAGIRAVKTMLQTVIATMGTSVVLSDINWSVVLSSAVLAGILSLLTSISGLPELQEAGTANEVTAEQPVPESLPAEEAATEEQ